MSSSHRALGEVFDTVAKKIKHEDKIKVLREHPSAALFYLLRLAYNDIPWALPSGAPPYKVFEGRKGASGTDLMNAVKRLYIFIKGMEPNMPQLRREKHFQDMLETLDSDEALVLLAVKDRTLEKQYKLPRKVVEAAFPKLLDPPFSVKFGHNPQQPNVSPVPPPRWM